MSSTGFQKWDIVYPLRYPESVQCTYCGNHFTINEKQECLHCKKINNVSNIIAKVRPMILWIGQTGWYRSMTFGIPLSTTNYYSDRLNHAIAISNCMFIDKSYEKPMRAVLCQATRADGCVIETKHLVGKITDNVVKQQIEDKLFNWLFSG
jgi:hypothetical protein